MAYIYKISNNINHKVYIGKTSQSIERRFREHCRDSQKDRNQSRPLYRAINKYGKDSFWVSLIEECPEENACDRERYWIKYYDSYKNGYNATMGGDGKYRCNRESVIEMYNNGCSQKEIVEEIGCDTKTCRNIIANAGNSNYAFYDRMMAERCKPIKQINQSTNEVVCVYNSIREAARSINKSTINAILRVLKGDRKSAYGYKWEYV